MYVPKEEEEDSPVDLPAKGHSELWNPIPPEVKPKITCNFLGVWWQETEEGKRWQSGRKKTNKEERGQTDHNSFFAFQATDSIPHLHLSAGGELFEVHILHILHNCEVHILHNMHCIYCIYLKYIHCFVFVYLLVGLCLLITNYSEEWNRIDCIKCQCTY